MSHRGTGYQRRARTAVITGASSGIGRATALAFADAGYALMITARRDEALQEVAAECRGRGAEVAVVPADVTNAAALAEVARQTVARFGWLDVWVNNAAVAAYGRTEEMPVELWHRVVEVNLFGAYHGARAAVPWLRDQGTGVLINVASILGRVPAPQQSAYTASKHAVRALSDSVRQEVRDAKGISVCTVLPGTVDTPVFQSAANVTGREVVAPGRVVDPLRVAATIVRCARRPRREVLVGAASWGADLASRLLPGLSERYLARSLDRDNFTDRPAAPTDGNLFQPLPAGARIDGGWRDRDGGRLAGRRPVRIGAGVVLGAGLLAAAARVRTARRNGQP